MPLDSAPLPFPLGEVDFQSPGFKTWLREANDRRRSLTQSKRPRILLGAGSVLAQEFVHHELAQGHVIALVDNARAGQNVDGVPVIGDAGLTELLDKTPDAIGIFCCGSEGAIAHFTRVWGARPQPLLGYFEVIRDWPEDAFPGHRLAFLPSFSDEAGIYAAHASARRYLNDSISLRTLDAVMLYRLTWDAGFIGKVAKPEKAIYFEPDVMPLGGHEVLVDGGAFDGDTVRDFAAKTGGKYKHIHAFELDPANSAAFMAKTAGIADVTLHQVGLWNEPAELGLEHRPDNGSRVSDTAEVRVPLNALDNMDVGEVSLIKLDVEGAEVQALNGARRLISGLKPKLAISAYHRFDDFVTLFETVRDIRDDYRFTLRHYSPIIYDSVIYAL